MVSRILKALEAFNRSLSASTKKHRTGLRPSNVPHRFPLLGLVRATEIPPIFIFDVAAVEQSPSGFAEQFFSNGETNRGDEMEEEKRESLVYFPRFFWVGAIDNPPTWGTSDYNREPTFRVASNDLPDIYRLLENWQQSPLVTLAKVYMRGRSMMPYDVVVVGGAAWQCQHVGWVEVE